MKTGVLEQKGRNYNVVPSTRSQSQEGVVTSLVQADCVHPFECARANVHEQRCVRVFLILISICVFVCVCLSLLFHLYPLYTVNNNTSFMAPDHVRAQSAYTDTRIH